MVCRLLAVVLLVLIIQESSAQIRMNTLRLQRKEVFEIQGSDIMVIDTLILGDSSKIILNKSLADNYIHAKKMVVGRGAAIDGRGKSGAAGKPGPRGLYAGSPCRDGSDGQAGTAGEHATNAVNLFLYVTELAINGTLIIDLTGGDGGEGGKGGIGGDGSAGTRLCPGAAAVRAVQDQKAVTAVRGEISQ